MKIDLEAIQAKIDNQKLTLSEKPPSATTGEYSDHARKLINWFFASMRTQWGAGKYNSQFGEGEDVNFAKRHWAPRIVKHTPEKLADMLRQADNQRISGNDKFAWPDVAAILSLQDRAWESRASHIDYTGTAQLENLTAKEERISTGKQQLSSLLKMDYTPQKPKFKHKGWDARMRAEEQAWVAHCGKLQAAASARYPDNSDMAGQLFYTERESALKAGWGL